jgi:hypothetical protein
MPLRREITQVFEAIPERIEVSGTRPTWRVTGGSFESVVSWANDAFDRPAVIAREDRNRWWPRVTLTVTTDPELAAEAPPLASFSEPRLPRQDVESPAEAGVPDDAVDTVDSNDTDNAETAVDTEAAVDSEDADDVVEASPAEPPPPAEDEVYSSLEDIFASQEARRPRHLPEQRRR